MQTDIRKVIEAMETVEEYDRGVLFKREIWWNKDKVNDALQLGVSNGWIFKPSVTQVEWTRKGGAALRDECIRLNALLDDICESKES